MFLDKSETPLRHFVLSVTFSFFNPNLSNNSFFWLLHAIFGCSRPLLPTAFNSKALLKTSSICLLITCLYYHTPRLGHFIQNIFKTQKFISSWLLLFSINLTPHNALIIALSVLLTTAISFSIRHHILLP